MWHNHSSKISAKSATPLASAGNFAAPAAAQTHRLKAVVPLINLTELAAYKRLFNSEVLPLLIVGVAQQAPSRPEVHHTAAPRAGGRSLAALLCMQASPPALSRCCPGSPEKLEPLSRNAENYPHRSAY